MPARDEGYCLTQASSDDLLFIKKKGSQKYILTMKRATAQSCGTSNGTFHTKRWVRLTYPMEYSAIKSVKLTPDMWSTK